MIVKGKTCKFMVELIIGIKLLVCRVVSNDVRNEIKGLID